jgi:hypothetical protein
MGTVRCWRYPFSTSLHKLAGIVVHLDALQSSGPQVVVVRQIDPELDPHPPV